MNKKINTISLFLIVLLTTVTSVNAQVDEEQIYKYNQVIENISNYYVDSVDDAKLVKSTIIATLKELDPHSVYFDKEEIEELNKGLYGSFVGVGITYDIINDTVLVLSVVKNGPSESAGLLPGDRIIFVEEENIAGNGINDEKLKKLLIGEKGSIVNVSIKRHGQKKIKKLQIIRDKIPINSIDAAYKVNDDIAYIKLNRFSASSINEFNQVIENLSLNNDDKIILDLRNNSGGYLYVSVKLLEFFLKKNSTVLYTNGNNNPEKEYKTMVNGKFKNSELVVLINESTASAGEIVSGAIQDWDRGVIIGRRSFGKGLVQKPFYLVDGSMIRLTIAKYYTPSGRNIQKPYNEGIENYRNEISERLDRGELMHKDSIKFNDSLKYFTLNHKRILYGGGGIMPDIFVELDTMQYSKLYQDHLISGKINEFIHLYVDTNREKIKKEYPLFDQFKDDFEINNVIIEKLIYYLIGNMEVEEVLSSEFLNNISVKIHLKALIAYDFWGENEYYRIMNENDEAFLKAVNILNDQRKYSDILLNEIIGDYIEK